MLTIEAGQLDFLKLNEAVRSSADDCVINGCLGQRFIAAGLKGKNVIINGVPGNALGAYLDGAKVEVFGNAQDAVGDTMDGGEIIVRGSVGDAAGYAMRGGRIFVKGNAGYRAGIHMKAYKEKLPIMVIGGTAGSFLGEYQAGGIIIVMGIDIGEKNIVGAFPCTGMHGGKMYLRSDCKKIKFPEQVHARKASYEDMQEIEGYISEFCEIFGYSKDEIFNSYFTVVTPDSKNPYKQMYVAN